MALIGKKREKTVVFSFSSPSLSYEIDTERDSVTAFRLQSSNLAHCSTQRDGMQNLHRLSEFLLFFSYFYYVTVYGIFYSSVRPAHVPSLSQFFFFSFVTWISNLNRLSLFFLLTGRRDRPSRFFLFFFSGVPSYLFSSSILYPMCLC